MVVQRDVARSVVKVDRSDDQVSDSSRLREEGEDGDIIFVVVAVVGLMVDYNAGCDAGWLAGRKRRGRHIR